MEFQETIKTHPQISADERERRKEKMLKGRQRHKMHLLLQICIFSSRRFSLLLLLFLLLLRLERLRQWEVTLKASCSPPKRFQDPILHRCMCGLLLHLIESEMLRKIAICVSSLAAAPAAARGAEATHSAHRKKGRIHERNKSYRELFMSIQLCLGA